MGDCFVQAYNNFFDSRDNNVLLVHGVVTGRGKIEGLKYLHAWIEIGDKVIDTTMSLFAKGFPKDGYYRLAQADEKEMFKYNKSEAIEKILKYETYGPWEIELEKYSI